MRPYMTVEEARGFLCYSKDTGIFTWAKSMGIAKKGDIAGTMNVHGYVQISIRRKLYLAHRIAWTLYHGEIPAGEIIHHKNGDKTDNRLENLELSTRESHNAHHNIERGRNEHGQFVRSCGRCEAPGGAK